MEENLTNILVNILLTEPFFGHLAAGVLRQSREDVADTALVLQENGTIILAVNPKFWGKKELSDSERYGAVKHELLHLAMQHPFRKAEFPRQDLYNLASDLVVNQYIAPEQLRPGQVTLDRIPSVNWDSHRGLTYYYRKLEEALAGKQGNLSAEDQQTLDGWLQEDHPAQQRHQHWSDSLDKMETAQKHALAAIWQHRLKDLVSKEAANSFHRLEEALREQIRRSIEVKAPALDWKRVLRMFASNSRKMTLKDTIRRPSKRYGTVPGIKIRRNQKLLVALDTSGSLGTALLSEFFREIHHLWRSGAELTIVECDDQIQDQYVYRGQAIREVSGRGSTAFEAPIQLANEQRVDGLIYLTDGFGPVPQVLPRMPMLWMISRQGIRPDSRTWLSLPGRVVKMN